MGSVRKASAWLGLVEDNDERYYDDDEYAEGAQTGTGQAWVTDPRVQVASEAAEETGRRIATVTPDSFRDARAIGELFRDGIPVIVNLTTMDPTDAKRVVDFAAGLTFGLRGSIERVATRVFLLTPADTQVVNGEARPPPAAGDMNHTTARRSPPPLPGTREAAERRG
ncbi:cell division protein SepF, partial [Streptomyces sp. NPDC059153]|uniref:cell division protein SepF n=1 Tax=Streptomyces sp. NPDC059153 TaxID=3346743 RepID=UPI0036A96EC3